MLQLIYRVQDTIPYVGMGLTTVHKMLVTPTLVYCCLFSSCATTIYRVFIASKNSCNNKQLQHNFLMIEAAH